MVIQYITEADIQAFISNRQLNIKESKRLLDKIALARLYVYIDECIVAQINRDTTITPYTQIELECLTKYIKPITLTLLEIEHIQTDGVAISNAGNKTINTDHSTTIGATERKNLCDVLYFDLNALKERLNTFLCDYQNEFPCFASKCLGCGCNKAVNRTDFY